MIKVYALKEEFSSLFTHCKGNIDRFIDELDVEQRRLIFEEIDIIAITRSALSFFQSSVQQDNDNLILDDAMLNCVHKVSVKQNYLQLSSTSNPFFELCTRLYPDHYLEENF